MSKITGPSAEHFIFGKLEQLGEILQNQDTSLDERIGTIKNHIETILPPYCYCNNCSPYNKNCVGPVVEATIVTINVPKKKLVDFGWSYKCNICKSTEIGRRSVGFFI